MNPDAFMPYYGNDFEAACKGFAPETKWAYLCALWHYWHHTHCGGLPADTETLQRICEVRPQDWARVGGCIFRGAPFFELVDGAWHQKNARKLHAEATEAYMARVAGAAKARAKADIKPDIKPDIKGDITPAIDPNQNQNQNQNQEPLGTKRERGAPPTLQVVLDRAQFVGLPEDEAKRFWNHFESVGWVDKNGHAITNWQAKLANWTAQTRAAPLEAAAKAGGLSGSERTQHNQELERINIRIRQISDGAAVDAMGNKYINAPDKAELAKLRKRRDELKKLLGVKY